MYMFTRGYYPKVEVPTIYKAYVSGRISTTYGLKYGTSVPPFENPEIPIGFCFLNIGIYHYGNNTYGYHYGIKYMLCIYMGSTTMG